jgi:hypothetical protein
MKLTTKYLLALITTLLLLNLSVAEAVRPSRTSGMGSLAYIGPQGPIGPAGPQGPAGADAPVLFPGDPYQGGIVFWVDQTGQHGLIAAKADQSSGIQWYNGTYFVTNATADGIYAGAKNTEVIISTQTNVGLACSEPTATPAPTRPYYCTLNSSTVPAATGDYAALVAANYSIQDDGVTPCTVRHIETCWGDWYLPSKMELKLMKYSIATDNEGTIRNLGMLTLGSLYWTSTESSQRDAWVQTMAANTSTSSQDKSNTYRVRAIRRF